MQLKTADDKQPDIDALQALVARPDVDARVRRQIENEIWSIRSGAKAEADAAYQIDFDLRKSRNWAVIHDLRLDIEGLVAQIDHLVISRLLEVFVCESKSFTGGVKVNDHGEWVTFRDGRPIGIPSPVEQNRRHIAVLERAIKLGYLKLPRRIVAIKPTFLNRVLISAHGSIGRPRRKLPELDAVVKVDQFRTHLANRDFSNLSMLKLVGSDTLESFGRQLVALHRPHRPDWARRFGVDPGQTAPVAVVEPVAPAPLPPKGGLRCARCDDQVSYAVAKFCWVNKPRFGGSVFCMPCQKLV
jgi:hypothetical protein